ncbi:MAG: AsmA family protein [Oceanicaulis sp.]|uniref:AsmA family protein n=1 Tax=Glycocaulis sp. TaxID=1969725 RepID=UPI0025BDD91F|nr:AsmA family protein [Glycocaulis sp.]MCC5980801.1 AsmA family protein [Oceanicaulis sp.]MCH8521632.1 AsmA family protein [Glycocaulis sp.]
MRRLLFILAVLAGLVIAAALIIPALLTPENWRSQIEQAASEQIGRTVRIEGEMGFTILPAIEIRAGNVSVGNADGFDEEPMASLSELRLGLALWPLFSRRVEVDEFVLVEPVIHLFQRGNQNNWTFGPDIGQPPAGGAGDDGFRRPGALPFEASLRDMRIENGRIRFTDGSDTTLIDGLDLSVQMASLDEEARVRAAFSYNGEAFTVTARLGGLRPFMEGARTPLGLDVRSAPLRLDFDGHALESATLDLEGEANFQTDLVRLGRLAGSPLPPGSALRSAAATGRFSMRPRQIAFADASFRLDEITATGGLEVDTGRERPLITGRIQIPMLDLNPYLPETQDGGAGAGGSPLSDEEIDLSALRLVDARINASADQLRFGDIEASNANLVIQLDNGRLVADLSRFDLYGGRGSGQMVVNARSATPSYTINATLNGLQAQPFLTAAAEYAGLSGTGNFNLDLASNGASSRAIMNSLSGQGRFAMTDGAIQGINLAQVIRTLQTSIQTRTLPSGFGEGQATDFTELSGSVNIRNGVVRNDDLAMLSPLLRVAGAGEFNLVEQTMDYRLNPRAVASLAGQGGDDSLTGITVPVRVRGSFAEPSFSVDFEAVLRELASGRARGLIDRLLPGQRPAEGETQAEEERQQTPAEQLLRGLLGSRQRQQEQPPEED